LTLPLHETANEMAKLQALLDASLASSTAHLRSIVTQRTMTAEQLTRVLAGMCTLAVSTVIATGEPRISGADGHFLPRHMAFRHRADCSQGAPPGGPPRQCRAPAW
jgi:hypothetical protein